MTTPKEVVVRILPDGTVQHLDHAGIDIPLGPASYRRASHVEPCNRILRWAFHLLRDNFGEKGRVAAFTRKWPCRWRVDLRPSGGPILEQTFRKRDVAITAEIEWLFANNLGKLPGG